MRVAARYEEDLLGSTTIAWPTMPYTERPGEKPRLGSGAYFVDDATCARDLAVNATRIEAWRRTECYKFFQIVRSLHLPAQILDVNDRCALGLEALCCDESGSGLRPISSTLAAAVREEHV